MKTVEVKNLSKRFRLSKPGNYLMLRDRFRKILHNSFYREKRPSKQFEDEFWAIKDINFSLNKGEVLGVIGANGAGKSTLLKILARISPPTAGKIYLNGRVASLLEVGTGFHPELSGRENIFLNGAILGMTKNDIKRKFNEIVEFSGIEKFLNVPVKHYSSGMAVRLAFSVAAHLEPDILIVDEVLAVGDAEFQRKCIGKMNEVTKNSGRTIIFVSHNMRAIAQICTQCLVIEKGKHVFYGNTNQAINFYHTDILNLGSDNKTKGSSGNDSVGDNPVRIKSIEIRSEGKLTKIIDITKPMEIKFNYVVSEEGLVFTHGCNLFNEEGCNILNSHDVTSDLRKKPREKGTYSAIMLIPGNFFSEGIIYVSIALFDPNPFKLYLHELNIASFTIVDSMFEKSARGPYKGGFPGVVRPLFKWGANKSGL